MARPRRHQDDAALRASGTSAQNRGRGEADVRANRRAAQPTRTAAKRRKAGTHLSFRAPMLPRVSEFATNETGAAARRAMATAQMTAPLEQARHQFLQTVAQLAPEVLLDLASLVGQGTFFPTREVSPDGDFLERS